MIFDVAPIAVHIGGQHGNDRWQMILQPGDHMVKNVCFTALRAYKNILSLCIQKRVVNVHGGTGFIGDGFGHECCKTIVFQGRFADQAFEEEYLISEFYRITMAQIYLDLTRAALLGNTINFEALGLGKVINVVDNWAIFINSGKRVGLMRRRWPPRAPHHGHNRLRRICVAGNKKKFHLWRNHRLKPLVAEQLHHALEDIAWRGWYRRSIAIIGIMNDLQGGIGCPRCCGGGVKIGAQCHIRLHPALLARRFRPFASESLQENRVGQVEMLLLGKF